jgi:hypothetical protein
MSEPDDDLTTQERLDRAEYVLGTLIAWLQGYLGDNSTKDLFGRLNSDRWLVPNGGKDERT